MLKKLILVALPLLVAVLVLAFPASSPAIAQGGLTYDTGVNVQNLSNVTATIALAFYPQVGSVVNYNDTIGPNAVKKYYPLPAIGSPFNGSLVVSSDQQVFAVANLAGNSFAYNASYESSSQGGTSVNLPLVARNNSGYFTWFNVQNAGSSTANVRIDYYPKPGLGNPGFETANVDPGRSVTFDQSANAAIGRAGDGRFVGSAVISSTNGVPVVAAASYLNTTTLPTLSAYRGFVAGEGSTSVIAPVIQSSNPNSTTGTFTGIQVQNVGNTTTTVTVVYTPPSCSGCTFTPASEQKDIGPSQAVNFLQTLQPSTQWDGRRYVGGATISSNNGMKLVALVSQFKPASPAQNSIYSGFDPASGTAKVIAPTIQHANGGFFSGIAIKNIDNFTSTVTVNYTANSCSGCTYSPIAEVKQVGPLGQVVFNQTAGVGQWDGTPAKRYVGGAVITTSGGAKIVATVNQFRPASLTGDTLTTYGAMNTAP